MKAILTEQLGSGGSGTAIVLTKIEVTSPPNKTSYISGDTFNSEGMVVTASYGMSGSAAVITTAEVTGSCTMTPQTLTDGVTEITITYSENGKSATTTQAVTVTHKVTGISVTTKPTTTTYTYGSTLNTSGMVVTATYSDSKTAAVTGYTCSPTSLTTVGTQTITVKYIENNTTVSTTFTVTVNKATGSFSLSSTAVSVNAGNYSSGVTVNVLNPTGTVSATSSNSTACPVSVSGNVITIKGDGSTAGTYTVTVSVAASTNYTAPANQTITVTIAYWEWGDETAVGDADWWAELKARIPSLSTEEKKALLGKTKKISLSTNVLGSSHFLMRCVGYDMDGSNTLAFESVYLAVSSTEFGSSGKWIGSYTREYCQNIYNYCSAKDSIKTVSKGTCASTSSGRTGTATYNDETVFLLSEREHGLDTYSPISTDSSSTTNAECTYGYNGAYQYFTDNSTRIKCMASDAAATSASSSSSYYWERSLYYDSSYIVCNVGSSGTAGYGEYNYSRGLAPAFVIG